MADAIDGSVERLKEANALDVAAAREAGTSATLIDRLTLTDKRIAGMTQAMRTIIDLPDPVGQVVEGRTRPNGIQIEHVREPLGVVAVIYEARPNLTADVAALCLKSGNAAVLRGSSIAMHTNAAIADVLAEVLRRRSGTESDPEPRFQTTPTHTHELRHRLRIPGGHRRTQRLGDLRADPGRLRPQRHRHAAGLHRL